MQLQAIVFDFDGVIADTEPVHLLAFQEELASVGLTLSQQEYLERYLGYNDREGFAAVAAASGRTLGAEDIEQLIARKTVRVQALLRSTPLLFPGVEHRIRDWSARVPVAIASGALRAEIDTILNSTALSSCFRAIVTADDPVASKPSPAPYTLAMSRLAEGDGLGLAMRPDLCVAIEDSLWGIVSARAAGMRVVAVTTSYGASALSEADLVIPTVADLTLDMLDDVVAART
ncbi:MAG: HAD family phosphatase [Vicinamibacterales bacterium]|nr:HAD family phosphatase [Vicinamibacterales bacterium]